MTSFQTLLIILRQIIFFTYLLYTAVSTLAQPDLKFTTISIQEGLSSNSINDILKDEYGFIWVATDDGLNRYDGQEIKIFRHDDSIKNSLIDNTTYCLFETKKHNFLIGTHNGLCLYNSTYESFEYLILEGIRVKHIIQSVFNNNLYFSTDKGLYLYSDDFKLIEHYDATNSNLPTSTLKDVKEDLKGHIWVAAYSFGAFELQKNGNFKSYTLATGKLDAHYVECLEVRNNGDILLSSYDHGIFKLDTLSDRFESLPCSDCSEERPKVIELYEDPDQRLWAGLDGGGLALYDDDNQTFFHYEHHGIIHSSINDNVITKIYNDKRGGLWVGSFYRGLNFVNLFSSAFSHLEEIKGASDHNIVSCILEDKNESLWLATDGGGIVHYNKNLQLIDSYNTDKSPFIGSNSTLHMAFDKNECLWVGTYFGGLQFIDPKNHHVDIYRHNENDPSSISADVVWYVYIDSKEEIWLGTQLGISKFNADTKTFTNFNQSNSPMKSENIRVIYEDKHGNYWFGSEDALYKYDINGIFHEYSHDIYDLNSICNNWVVTITEDNDGVLWFGTYGGGISSYNAENDSFKNWDERSGLCNNFVCAILSDNNNDLWISTFKGLSHFNQESNTFKTYHEEDGLQGDKFSINAFHKAADGRLMFGGVNGLTSFDPENISSNPYPPNLVLTDFRLLNKSVDLSDEKAPFHQHISHVKSMVLPYDYSVFTIHFASLNYIQSNKNQYAYRLKGFDKEWNYVGNKNEATYTNLTPRTYTFELKASNNNNIWTNKPLTLKITITPPFYRTWWFRIAITLVITIILLIIYKLRIKHILRQKKLLKRTVDQRTRTIHLKTKELEFKNQTHLESLNYAKLIQEASLPSMEEGKKTLNDLGVLYMPSHIVSGDFYWMKEIDGQLIIAVVDCTGHGVPGAFMSLIGHVALNNIIHWRGIRSPSEILEELHKAVVRALRQNYTNNRDGMDMSVVVINKKEKTLSFSGAMNPLVYIQNNQLKVIKAVRRGVGGMYLFNRNKFSTHIVDLSTPTSFYLYTDGYQDQFGGDQKGGKKFLSKKLKTLLLENHHQTCAQQMEILAQHHYEWRRTLEQTDDILIFGAKIDLFNT
jgi:ligand-binding sensor domain-containing protein/serine phosphatase RsbU (regulator of sigma subunit)